ncbi:hypothetical protein [Streptomyces sp. NPDC047990]|uniref:hypothetical protein n=1 Tax=Streptomyces sp. NPDC047990 TaxID=3365496 RepID=UPI003712C349
MADRPDVEDFGHEPMNIITNGKLRAVVCARCVVWDHGFNDVAWPCTSAIVLGLVPRKEPSS